MERYFRLKKQIPGTLKMTDLVKLDDKGWVWKKDKNNNSAWFTTHHTKEDVEMTEYFEESVGMSADKYVLFKGDTVYFLDENTDNVVISTVGNFASTFEGCYYKKENVPVNILPKTWEDLKEISGYWIQGDSNISKEKNLLKRKQNKNIFYTESQAKSALAYAQLSQLVAKMNGEWLPSFEAGNSQGKYFIERLNNKLQKESTRILFVPLCFKSPELRDFSLEHHTSLWKVYYQIEE